MAFATVVALAALIAPLGRCQTFPGFEPATANPLAIVWNNTPLNYSGERLSISRTFCLVWRGNLQALDANLATPVVATTSPPTFGLPASTGSVCSSGTFLLAMVDPDATQGNISTQVRAPSHSLLAACGTEC
jgi:hypothetical protein